MLSRLRSSRLLRVLLALVAVGFLGYGLLRNGEETAAAISRLSWWSLAGSYLSVMAGICLMMLAWRALLAGMGSPLPPGITARIFFIGQLGKYVPGSVWAYAAMIELGRDHRVPPRRMFGAITLSVLVSLGCALVVAAVTLRETMPQAWYLLALIPVIAVCLHPGVLTFGLNLAMRIARQEPLGPGRLLSGRAVLTAVALTVAGWLTYGPHLLLPMADLGAFGDSRYLVATGAYALAWATGILTVVVPAGIGVREGAMVLALAPVLDSPSALVAAVVSRVMFTLADVSWAGIGFLWGRVSGPPGEPIRKIQESVREAGGSVRETRESVRETRESVRETRESVRETRESVRETRESVRETRESVREAGGSVRETRESVRETGPEPVTAREGNA